MPDGLIQLHYYSSGALCYDDGNLLLVYIASAFTSYAILAVRLALLSLMVL